MVNERLYKEIFSSFPESEEVLLKAKRLSRKRDRSGFSQNDIRLARLYKKFHNKYKRGLQKARTQEAWEKKVSKSSETLSKLNQKILKQDKLFCMDIETYERSQRIIEVGVSIYHVKDKKIENIHYIVKENLKYRNGRFVPDNKEKFQFGNSKVISMEEIKKDIFDISRGTSAYVGHAFGNDKFFLSQCGVKENLEVFDTARLSMLYFKDQNQMSLTKICESLGFKPEYMHNAGNDSYWTLTSLLKMLSIE